jgi:hypothetical protein
MCLHRTPGYPTTPTARPDSAQISKQQTGMRKPDDTLLESLIDEIADWAYPG